MTVNRCTFRLTFIGPKIGFSVQKVSVKVKSVKIKMQNIEKPTPNEYDIKGENVALIISDMSTRLRWISETVFIALGDCRIDL